MNKPHIPFSDFNKLDLRIGKIIEAVHKEGSDKLIRLVVDFGEFQRVIFTGIAAFYKPEELLDKSFLFIVNLEPKKIMDEYSQGMLLAANADIPTPLIPTAEVKPGTEIR